MARYSCQFRDQIVTQIISVKQNNGDNMYICGAFL